MSTPGLRERKKAATKLALSQAAVSLMLDKGLDAISGDAIAAAAGVAPRTFRNYFSSKEEAVLFAFETVQSRYVETFMAQDPAKPVLDALEAAVVGMIEAAEPLDQLVAAMHLMSQNPALKVRRVASRGKAIAGLLREVADRTGTDADFDLYPRLLVRAAGSVALSVIELYAVRNVPRSELVRMVHRGFDQIRAGLGRPDGAR